MIQIGSDTAKDQISEDSTREGEEQIQDDVGHTDLTQEYGLLFKFCSKYLYRMKPGFQHQSLLQSPQIFLTRDFLCAELREMRGIPLGVEQREAALLEYPDEMPERDLGGVGDTVEHRLPEECSTDSHSVEPSGQPALLPNLHRVGAAILKERLVTTRNRVRDPGLLAGRASLKHSFEVTVDPEFPSGSPQGAAESVGHMKLFQGEDAPWVG